MKFILPILVVLSMPYAELTFSVKAPSNFSLQSADFGIEMGAIHPYISLSALSLTANGKFEAEYWDDRGSGMFKSDDDVLNGKGSAYVFLPSLGMRFNILKEDFKPYIFGNFFKAFAIIDAEYKEADKDYYSDGTIRSEWTADFKDGKLTETIIDYDTNGVETDRDISVDDYSEEIKEISKVLSPWGFGFGFGADYKILDHLSVFGEYGFKLYFTSSDFSKSNVQSSWRDEWSEEVSASIKMTSGAIGLRFRF